MKFHRRKLDAPETSHYPHPQSPNYRLKRSDITKETTNPPVVRSDEAASFARKKSDVSVDLTEFKSSFAGEFVLKESHGHGKQGSDITSRLAQQPDVIQRKFEGYLKEQAPISTNIATFEAKRNELFNPGGLWSGNEKEQEKNKGTELGKEPPSVPAMEEKEKPNVDRAKTSFHSFATEYGCDTNRGGALSDRAKTVCGISSSKHNVIYFHNEPSLYNGDFTSSSD